MSNDTLATLRSRLQARLGFAATGAAAGVNQTVIDSFLQEAQLDLYWAQDWVKLSGWFDVSIGVNQYQVSYPSSLNPERIKRIALYDSDDNLVSEPKQGINAAMLATLDTQGVPSRYELYEQLTFWPRSDQAYTVRCWGVKNLANTFSQNNHASTIDSDMVFKVALGRAKAHYRQPDAQIYVEGAQELLARIKGGSWGNRIFTPGRSPWDRLPDPHYDLKPQRV